MSDVLVVAEAGSNWRMGSPRQDVEMAKVLIDLAAEAQADAVKFQVFRAESTYAHGSGPCPHLWEKGVKEKISEVFSDLEMPYEVIPVLADYANTLGLQFMASCFSPADFEAVDPYVSTHKIASPELHHPELLELTARSKKPVLLSTGISTQEEIEWALGRLKGSGPVTLMQCTVQYPTDPDQVHLRAMRQMGVHFDLEFGLSDHTRDPITAPVAAVAMGAKVVEKHYTIHNRMVGPDHGWAVTGEQLKMMCRAVRTAEQMLGQEQKMITEGETALRQFSRRSIHAIRQVRKGETFRLGHNVAVLRPGTQKQGTHPRYLTQIEGAIAKRHIEAGEGVIEGDWL